MNINLDLEIIDDQLSKKLLLSGEIDAYTAPKLKEALLPLTKETGKEVIVDLENVKYMDSTGLGVFISALKSSKEHNSSFKLINLQERVERLFKITSLDKIMTIENSLRGGNK
ncbi:MAG: STAS domain-containing protein [Amphibacillus sp.]|uniref:Anti-sigma factor antagonist n=1 Tax=Amphibacillus xylanus (strain ATCC 51415 / DSM 6626 / JCM 7361 / LMG 17667 / NBRC 15112 / Ep01) TaxID=698758 RepID=K0IVK5_AMPXN|nr:STAS domain-containing protein [Amphibacillus xylanus]NMA90398.1 STAS domain-containing protein [Amphibacillus sp.]BAM46484.1 anti-sigma B factor antagonist [Amphibacillus xylanus NBRC 15112]